MHRLTTHCRGCGGRAASLKGNERRHVATVALCQPLRLLPIALICAAQVVASIPVRADPVPETMNGVPLLPIPTYEEVGLPAFTMPTGTPTTASPSSPPSGSGSGNGTATGSDVLNTMQAQSWGYAATANAESMGVNPSALAATCAIESNCQNVAARSGSTVNGAFQMTDGTYTADINKALAENPSLAASIVPGLAGKMDPATEAIASAQELKTTALNLQKAGIDNPTALDARGGYNFGSANAAPLAQAQDNQLMSQVLIGTSQATMAANGVTSSTTVGQWRQTVSAKLGGAANQPVLIQRT